MGEDASQDNKKFRKSKKRKRKEVPKDGEKSLPDPSRNAKAFAVNSAKNMRKQFVRKQDIKTKKHHVPVLDRAAIALEPPPIIIAVVGAPKVGKSTLIKCLLRKFTNLKLTSLKGPITVVASKKNRLTFIECNNDICSMIDTAKVADLVLLMIDASFGFEMEAFEFLSVCQVHGMPRVIGVLTHLDCMRDNKALKRAKKYIKHRFWDEVYQGAKLFYFTKFVKGEYLKREVHNLARFISVMKYKPIAWRNNHPYLLADRLEDLTSSERLRINPKCERTVCLYGYARGSPFMPFQDIHVPGCGDFKISDISFLPDPCPLPDVVKKRVLNEKEHLVYSPFSGVGGIVYDKDAVYIELGGSHSHSKRNNDEESEEESKNGSSHSRFKELMNEKASLDEKLKGATMSLFGDSTPVASEEFQRSTKLTDMDSDEEIEDDASDFSDNDKNAYDDEDSDDDEEDSITGDESSDGPIFQGKRSKRDSEDPSDGRFRRIMSEMENGETHLDVGSDSEEDENDAEYEDLPNHFGVKDLSVLTEDVDDENDDDDTGELNWKRNLKEKAALKFSDRLNNSNSLKSLVYGAQSVVTETDKQNETEAIADLFTIRSAVEDTSGINGIDVTLPLIGGKVNSGVQKRKKFLSWLHKSNRHKVQNCFITGNFGEEDAEKLLKEDDDAFGDFEDLENDGEGEKDDEKVDENQEDNVISGETLKDIRKKNYEKKRKQMKEIVDSQGRDKDSYYEELKTEVSAQAKLNQTEFEDLDPKLRVQFEGYRAGLYLRIEITGISPEFMDNFDPNYPVVIGGLGQSENTIGYLNLRVKKHRWFRKILKSKDPVVMSVGWRRYQTMSTYSVQDHNMRNRYLKYTPEFMHCTSTVFGPIVPQGTGCLFVENLARETPHFRVTATGAVMDLDKSTNVVKKLKLVGYPEKIFKNTAFIKGMFNSALEVSKFIGANIRTVSGVKGQVKQPLHNPPGAFRAAFEDKIRMSDIIFLRSWYPIDIPQFYMPVFNLLDRTANREQFNYGLKTVGQLRFERGLSAPSRPDSKYHHIEKVPMKFKPLVVPNKLQKKLPFSVRPKFVKNPKKKTAVIREPHERKLAALINEIRGVHGEKKRSYEQQKQVKLAERKKKLEKIEMKKLARTKELRKRLYKSMMKSSD